MATGWEPNTVVRTVSFRMSADAACKHCAKSPLGTTKVIRKLLHVAMSALSYRDNGSVWSSQLSPVATAGDFLQICTLGWQPLSARCMHTLLRFRMGAHSLPVMLQLQFNWAGALGPPGLALVPLVQAACSSLNGMMRDALRSECPAMQCVRDRCPALFCSADTPCSCSCGSVTSWGWHTTS